MSLRTWLAASLLIAAIIVIPRAVWPQDSEKEADLHLRALAYDRNLKTRAGARLVVGVLFLAKAKESSRVAEEMGGAFRRLGEKIQVQGLPVSVLQFPFERDTPKQLKNAGVTALYVAPGLEDATEAIAQLSRSFQVPVMCRSRDQVKAGLTIGVVEKDGLPSIIVNLPAAKAAGMDLSSDLFKVAEVFK